MNITAKLKNAYFERLGNHLIASGIVGEDIKKRWPDGTPIHTSAIQKIIVVTRNSTYEIDPNGFSLTIRGY
tara:strand:- start:4205 stop:4417 length:213 start_codon:yes stop_codon:yes gene_type:complete